MIKKKNNIPTLIYLTDSSLSLQTEKKVLLSVSYPKELVKDKTILDEDALTAFISAALDKVSDAKNVKVIVVGKGILFQTAVPLDSSDQKEKEFFASIPYEKSDMVERRIQTKTKEYILVTSKKFYQIVINGLKKQSSSISSVVPLSLFVDEVDEDVLAPDDVKAIFSKEQLYSQANFLESYPSTTDSKNDEEINVPKPSHHMNTSTHMPPFTLVKKWNITALLVILGFLVISTLVFGGFLFMEQKRFSNAPAPTQVVSEVTPEPTEAVTQEVDKGSLTVAVLNGTGTAGQAGKVKLIMEELGYNSVSTGNADSADNTKTTVSFSDKVSKLRGDEIVKELEKVFTSVTRAKDDSLTNDIIVVTGEEK
jgi:hypothetical protein